MVKYFTQIMKFLLFGNFFIAFCALSQGLLTYHLLHIKPNVFVEALLFFATICVYNFSILLNRNKIQQNFSSKRTTWIFKHDQLNIGITVISALSLIPIGLMLGFKTQLLLGFLCTICISYAYPFFKLNEKKFSLREVKGLKIFLIALVWSISVVYLPALEANEMASKNLFLLWVQQFLFIVAITIPFDVRDLLEDTQNKIATIPTMFGESKAYLISLFMLFGFLILILIGDGLNFSINFFALFSSLLITSWLIFKSKRVKNEVYYYLYLDGTLLLQYILLLFFNYGFKYYSN